MSASNPKRPPRRPPPDDSKKDAADDTTELPFDEREATPLDADDPAPQKVTTYPVRVGRRARGRDTVGALALVSPFSENGSCELSLYAEHGPGTGQLLPVPQGAVVLGRSSSCDLRLPHASISRRHARLTRRGERLFLEDLGSQNGTFVDDERLSGPRELQLGQRIHVGPAVLRIRVRGAVPVTHVVRKPKQPRPAVSAPWRVALAAGIAGFLLAATSALWVARMHPQWLVRPVPAAQR